MELDQVEKYLKNAIITINQKLQTSKKQLDTTKSEKTALAAKLDRKLAELERVKQRLEALQKIRFNLLNFLYSKI